MRKKVVVVFFVWFSFEFFIREEIDGRTEKEVKKRIPHRSCSSNLKAVLVKIVSKATQTTQKIKSNERKKKVILKKTGEKLRKKVEKKRKFSPVFNFMTLEQFSLKSKSCASQMIFFLFVFWVIKQRKSVKNSDEMISLRFHSSADEKENDDDQFHYINSE